MIPFTPTRAGDTIKMPDGRQKYMTHFFPDVNMLISAHWFRKKRGKVWDLSCLSGSFWNLAGRPQPGILMADSGAFTAYRKGCEPLSPADLAEIYNVIRPDVVFHSDIPVWLLSRKMSELSWYFKENPSLRELLRRNIELAGECQEVFSDYSSRTKDVRLVPVAQGVNPSEYVTQVRELADIGFDDFVAVGGLGGRSHLSLEKIMTATSHEASKLSIKLHLLGVGRLGLLSVYRDSIESFDCTTPLNDAWRDGSGAASYYYAYDGDRELIRIPLEKIWSGKMVPQECKCLMCSMFGEDIFKFGNSNFNRARSFHNAALFQEYIRVKFEDEV